MTEYPRFQIKKRRSPESGHHKFWRVFYAESATRKPKRVATYLNYMDALAHVEKCVTRFGRGYL